MGVCLSVFNTVRKSNVLNEIRNSDITTAEYRLFCTYLAHFKMNEPDNNTVTFNLADYTRIVGLDRPRKADIENQAKNILSRSVQAEGADGGFTRYSLFDTFKLHKKDGDWLVTLECGHKIAPLIREERGRFIRYKLYNTIFLKSFNQQRIYELLKQYERIGERTFTLEELREMLSIKDNEYPKWAVFARDVLKVAQSALEENTDITFEYVPIKKGRPVVAVKFIIRKNENYKDKLQLEGFLPKEIEYDYEDGEVEVSSSDFDNFDMQQTSMFGDIPPKYIYESDYLEFLADACGFEFSNSEMKVILALEKVQSLSDISLSLDANKERKYKYLQLKYREFLVTVEKKAETDPIENRFGYFKSMIANDET